MPFDGLRVLSLESRRAADLGVDLCLWGLHPNIPFERLFAGDFDVT